MFQNDEAHRQTVDWDRKAVLKLVASGVPGRPGQRGEKPDFFVLQWGHKQIPFWADAYLGHDSITGVPTVRWEVTSVGAGSDFYGVPHYSVESKEEVPEIKKLIRESLEVYGYSGKAGAQLITTVLFA